MTNKADAIVEYEGLVTVLSEVGLEYLDEVSVEE